jgi:predicted transcriptional regulator
VQGLRREEDGAVKRQRTNQVAFRLPVALLRRLDRIAEKRSEESGMAVSRTGVVRALLLKAVEQEEGRR